MLPEPLTTTRRLYSAKPFFSRSRRNRAGPGPRFTSPELTVRAPDMTASAVARNSSRCSKSRRLVKVETAWLAVAILPSAVIAMLTKTSGSPGSRLVRFEFNDRLPSSFDLRVQKMSMASP